MESAEHARRRVFKGIVGRRETSHFELAARGVRRARRSAEERTGKRFSRKSKELELAVLSLLKLCDSKEIEKRRKRKQSHSPGRYGL